MNALVAEWVAKAEGDLHTARREVRVRRNANYDAVCYHAQQCAEKMLKAYLVAQNQNPLFTHNLVELLQKCLKHDKTFDLIRLDLEALNGYGVVIRYPGTSAGKQDATDAVKSTQRVRDFVLPKL